MNAHDRIRIQHMLEAAAEAAAFIRGRTSQELTVDRMLLLALVKEIEIIGEAATQVSEELRERSPDIPWARIKGMRNRLIHAYSDVNVGLVWSTVVSDPPELVRSLEQLLARNPQVVSRDRSY
jgi:uncharacterized protein with HEPN domain